MIKYKAMFNKIEKVEFVRETDKTVTVVHPPSDWAGRSELIERKTNSYCAYRDTFEEAKKFLIDLNDAEADRVYAEIKRLNKRFDDLTEKGAEIRSMVEK